MRKICLSANIAEENTFVLIEKDKAAVIDPGFNGKEALAILSESGIKEVIILLTHGHFDHIRDIPVILDSYDAPIYIQEMDKEFLYDERLSYARAFHSHFSLDRAKTVITFKEKESISFFHEEIKAFHTPGHTGGSAVFLIGDNLYSGDTLFKDGVGRTDLYTGNMNDLTNSLKFIRSKFSRQINVLPGHGPSGKMESVIEENPYF